MEQLLATTQHIGVVAVALVLQYFFVRRNDSKLGFIFPAIYFVLAILSAVNAVQNGTVMVSSVMFTALLSFLMSCIIPLMLFMVWWKRYSDISTIIIAVVAVYILSNVAMMIFLMVASLFIAV